VDVVRPTAGTIERTTSQPGSVQAFECVRLYAGVSGYLKTLNVDIGDPVKKGQVLACVDVPELREQVRRRQAGIEQADARVLQMKARVESARAELDAAQAAVPQAEALAKSKAAELRFRQKQLERYKDLFASKSIDERLVDEKVEYRDAAREAEMAAREAVTSAKARVVAAAAKIRQAEADVQEAEAEVKVARAELENAQVLVRFATVVSPFDGVIAQRNYFPGDFVRGANESAGLPLLVVHRTDRMRVVVQIPDRDVPYCDPGDPAEVEVDALPGQRFDANVSRIGASEDPETRLMHVEIDMANPTGKIRHGMFGRVVIRLDRAEMLTVPASCLVDKPRAGKAAVLVVRGGRALRVPVQVGGEDGGVVGIAAGLTPEDEVVVRPGGVSEGAPVAVAHRTPTASNR
jgi:RND family efflux transporter MFP subunit